MSSSLPQFNPLASSVLASLLYTPVISVVGAHFGGVAIVTPFVVTKIGSVVRVGGAVAYNVTGAAAAGEVMCKITVPPIGGVPTGGGVGVTNNAVAKGAAAGSGVVQVAIDAPATNMKLIIDAQPFVANGYVVVLDFTLTVLDADAT